MSFIIDKQTIQDLNLLSKYDSKSIYHIYDHALTRGGQKLMEHMFHNPLMDCDEINTRSALFHTFMEHPCVFPFDEQTLDDVEYYLSLSAQSNYFMHLLKFIKTKAMLYIAGDRTLEMMSANILKTLHVFKQLSDFTASHSSQFADYVPIHEEVTAILTHTELSRIMKYMSHGTLSLSQVMRCHRVLRITCASEVSQLMSFIYQLDLQISVAKVAVERDFTLAKALPSSAENPVFSANTLFHPSVQGAKGNDLQLSGEENMVFLTGANMAGKSTFMKSVGIALYLAHMGFPVPAKELEFTPMHGMFTSINVSDDINKGYSHYYAEVMRVKHIAEHVGAGHNLFVILDELFKGTNVKDAMEATSEVTRALSKHHNCFFIVSTHILEVAETLKDCPNIQYSYFPTEVIGGVPRYTYKLTKGITSDRQGVMIIRNEQIIEMIRGGKQLSPNA